MSKKPLILMAFSLLMGLVTSAQLNLVLQVPPTGVMQKNQLWNMALVNAGNSAVTVSIQLTLLSTVDNQPVMTAISRAISLPRGTTSFNQKDLSPIMYDYLSPIFNVDRDPNGFLPVGNYKACYSILQSAEHGNNTLAEECTPVEVQPLAPPQLNMPSDTATLETCYPQFSWVPPAPLNLFSNLTYDLLLVEVKPGQGAHEAIQQNIPVYNISRYKDVSYIYPPSNKALDTGRTYAWRIIALNEGNFIAQSEVWTFKLAAPKAPSVTVPGDNYILLRSANELANSPRRVSNGVLGVKYYSYDKEHAATINFLSTDGAIVRTVQQKIVYGENFISFKIDRSFQTGKVYRLVLTDEHKNKYTASFILQ